MPTALPPPVPAEEDQFDDAPIDRLREDFRQGDDYIDDTTLEQSADRSGGDDDFLTLTSSTTTWLGLRVKTGKSQKGVRARIRRYCISLLVPLHKTLLNNTIACDSTLP